MQLDESQASATTAPMVVLHHHVQAPFRHGQNARLVTTTAYNQAGEPYQVTGSQGYRHQSAWDDAGRLTSQMITVFRGLTARPSLPMTQTIT